jgi:hypothetical protein
VSTVEQARAFALELPETEEASHFGKADFRVGGKVFGSLPRPGRMNLRLDPAEQAAAVGERPDAFEPAPGAWGRQGWTGVELALVEADELRELVVSAWLRRAPSKLAAAYERAHPPAP